jgi:hypothetical protein
MQGQKSSRCWRDLPRRPRMVLASADCRRPLVEHTQGAAPAKTRFCDSALRNGIVAQNYPLPPGRHLCFGLSLQRPSPTTTRRPGSLMTVQAESCKPDRLSRDARGGAPLSATRAGRPIVPERNSRDKPLAFGLGEKMKHVSRNSRIAAVLLATAGISLWGGAAMEMTLKSPAFKQNGHIPSKYACENSSAPIKKVTGSRSAMW